MSRPIDAKTMGARATVTLFGLVAALLCSAYSVGSYKEYLQCVSRPGHYVSWRARDCRQWSLLPTTLAQSAPSSHFDLSTAEVVSLEPTATDMALAGLGLTPAIDSGSFDLSTAVPVERN